ncbi:PREDICTED: probable glycosyltransferase At5g03795 [Fragaria vesca subsp. vesca]|uniref:probable glycosyltransferase At5g03795 n=1 Tax=Fragaria vesca subsp. vesca TaxID=101020 RepID=UPI0002C2EEF7|nr:PREDICTED: probable glycosyltransferase At5g03795 [Fragaria vesca subsp. vesca]
MMANGNKKPGGGGAGGSGGGTTAACWSSSSYKAILVFIVPLVVVFGLISLLSPKSSNWVFISNYYLAGPSPNTSASNLSEIGASHDDVLGLRSTVVVMDMHSSTIEEVHSDDYVQNRSASPPLAVEEATPPPLEPIINGTNDEVPMNETDANSAMDNPATRRKEYTHLGRLEGRLRRARVAIREAKFANKTHDADYIPNGPMYWNANAFQRSYLEMEKRFKVFVYEEGEPPLFHNGPCKSIYSMEGNFIHEIEVNKQFRTRNPEEAHVYFLPYSVTMLVRFVYVRDSHDFSPIRQTVRDYVNIISTKYPYWNRSLAADHFTVACHDWGPETSNSDPYLRKNSIRGLCNANTSEGFNPSKDVSFPEVNLQTGDTHGFLGGPSPRLRSILAFFAGGVHGPIRPILLEHWENKDKDMRVHQYLPKGVSYYDMMKKSKFCLCPSGYEVASPRVVEAIYTGCVPVLISDHYVPPFSDVLNWKSFSVEVSVSDIPNLKNILTSISTRQYLRMQKRVIQVRKHFEVNSPPKRFDVFHMILHSIWLRRLNVRVHDDQ